MPTTTTIHSRGAQLAPLVWKKTPGATPEYVAEGGDGTVYRVAKYHGQPRAESWRLWVEGEEESRHWSPTLADAKANADAYNAQAARWQASLENGSPLDADAEPTESTIVVRVDAETEARIERFAAVHFPGKTVAEAAAWLIGSGLVRNGYPRARAKA